MSIRTMLPFVAGGAFAVFVLELGRLRPAAETEPFDDEELAATDDAAARLWPTEPTFDWGPDDEGLLLASLALWRDLAARVQRPAPRRIVAPASVAATLG